MNRLENAKKLIEKGIGKIAKLENPSNNGKKVVVENPFNLSYTNAKSGRINVKELKESIYLLIECDDYLYRTAPHHQLDDKEAQKFCKLIIQCRKHLDNILKDFGYDIPVSSLKTDVLYIVSSNKLLKSLKNKNPSLNIISTEGPLEPEDMKIINPKIPDKSLEGIRKKCSIKKEEIEKLIKKLNPSEIIVIVEEGNIGDELVYKRSKELYGAKKMDIEDIL